MEFSSSNADEAHDPLFWAIEWLARHHAKNCSRAVLYAGLPHEARLSPQLAVRMLEQIHLKAGWAKREVDSLHVSLLPTVITCLDGNAWVITARKGKGEQAVYTVFSPENQGHPQQVTATEMSAVHSGYVLLCSVQPKKQPPVALLDLPPAGKEGHWLFTTLWRYRHYYLSAALATLLANILTLASTFFTMNVYDRVVPTQAYVTLWSLAIGVVVAIVMEFFTRLIRARLLDTAGKKADLLLGSRLFQQLLAIRLENRPQSSGSFANQLREFESVRDFMTSATLTTLADLPFCLLFVGIIYLIGGPLAWVLLCAILVVIIASFCIQWPLAKSMQENLREISLKQGVLIETIEGLETLKAVRGEGSMQMRWEEYSALAAASSIKAKAWSSAIVTFVSFVQQMTTVAMVTWGVYLIHAGELTMGSMIGTVILAGRSLSPLASVVGLAVRFQQARAALGSLNRLMEMPVERNPEVNYIALPATKGDLTLEEVGFSYPASGMIMMPQVLKSIALTIRAGERVAILGNIGSGKSTLLKIMAMLYQPTAGKVTLNNLDASQIDPADWRSLAGYVGQESRLFSGTLRDNITLGDPGVTTEDFLHVARVTGVERIAARHPSGYAMPVGERGQGLSGGQKQLVSLARSLLLKPQILLMDEPTSSMDTQTEKMFVEHLQKSLTHETLVLVTHRHSLLSLVDRLIVLDNGKVVANGPKDEVIASLQAGNKR